MSEGVESEKEALLLKIDNLSRFLSQNAGLNDSSSNTADALDLLRTSVNCVGDLIRYGDEIALIMPITKIIDKRISEVSEILQNRDSGYGCDELRDAISGVESIVSYMLFLSLARDAGSRIGRTSPALDQLCISRMDAFESAMRKFDECASIIARKLDELGSEALVPSVRNARATPLRVGIESRAPDVLLHLARQNSKLPEEQSMMVPDAGIGGENPAPNMSGLTDVYQNYLTEMEIATASGSQAFKNKVRQYKAAIKSLLHL